MDSFNIILRNLRVSCGLSQVEVALRLAELGIATTNKSVSSWENGTTKPDVPTFLRLCCIYGVRDPASVFLGEESLNFIGWQRVAEYTGLLLGDPRFTEAGDAPAKAISETSATPKLLNEPKEELELNERIIPLYDMPASAGAGVFLDYVDFVELRVNEDVPYETDYALRISGDSMWPSYDNGQIIYVKKQEHLRIGEIGIFILNSEVYCKELGHSELISHNEDYDPIPLSQYDAFYILGKVLN